jgi:Domain of unknown function (DUF1844)
MSRPDGASGESDDSLPAIDFATFVLSLSHNVLVHLGDAPDPSGGASKRDVAMAKQTIDLLAVLSEKTAGNLTGEEERLLDQILIDLRMRYEEVVREA